MNLVAAKLHKMGLTNKMFGLYASQVESQINMSLACLTDP